MPIVRIVGWRFGNGSPVVTTSLLDLLRDGGNESEESLKALDRLIRNKFVDTCFDLGEDATPKAFAKKVQQNRAGDQPTAREILILSTPLTTCSHYVFGPLYSVNQSGQTRTMVEDRKNKRASDI